MNDMLTAAPSQCSTVICVLTTVGPQTASAAHVLVAEMCGMLWALKDLSRDVDIQSGDRRRVSLLACLQGLSSNRQASCGPRALHCGRGEVCEPVHPVESGFLPGVLHHAEWCAGCCP